MTNSFFRPSLALIIFALGLLAGLPGDTNAQTAKLDFDWSQMLAQQDLVWEKLPKTWKESPFIGNGEQGSMIYQTGDNVLHWSIGCSAAHDHRPAAEDDFEEKNVAVVNRGRLFIGHLELRSKGGMKQGTARLNLWDAEVTGTLDTTAGAVEWRTLVHANQPVTYIEVTGKKAVEELSFAYVAALAQNPRAIRNKVPREPANPKAELGQSEEGINTAVHNLHAGGQTAVAWKQARSEGKLQLWISVQHSFPDQGARDKAVAAVVAATEADLTQWVGSHRDWWHQFYPQSYLATGESYWDSFYWTQQYKLACATRDKGWIPDNQGPWLQPTAWNALWWNLNVQIAQSGFTTANRRGMGSALSHRLDINRDGLALNVAEPYRHDSYAIGRGTSGWDLLGPAGQPGGRPPMDKRNGHETGNLLWALHNVDMEVRYWQDEELRDRVLYPLLVRAVNYYVHFLKTESDGLLHLPPTHSPELINVADCSYDLDLLRWAAGRLVEIADAQGITENQEPLIAKWKEIRDKLVPTSVDPKTGIMVGKNAPLKGPHRHWSHLLAIFPLRTLTPEQPADRELIQRSLDHWHSFKRGGMGYSVTGGSCIASLLGDGERAYEFLNRLKGFLLPNTFYVELGKLPVIETPFHGATAIQDMLLQSWGGRLRVFPAVPEAWPNARFYQLRGEGAFIVSAVRNQQKTQWVTVRAEVGGSFEVDASIEEAQWVASERAEVTAIGEGVFKLSLPAGGEVSFWPKGEPKPNLSVTPIETYSQPHQQKKGVKSAL